MVQHQCVVHHSSVHDHECVAKLLLPPSANVKELLEKWFVGHIAQETDDAK